MELKTFISRRVVKLFLQPAARVELDARALVQKVAREEAAVRALRVGRLQGADAATIERLCRRARNARLFRDCALRSLRKELGLPEYPTQAELADWGPAPIPPKMPVVSELGI